MKGTQTNMSANVKQSAGTGKLPWWIGLQDEDHGQFTHLGDADVTAEIMCKASGLDYEVAKSPVFTYASKQDLADRKSQRVEGRYAIIRSDTMKPLSDVTVGKGYTVMQNAANFDILDHITGRDKAAHYTQAGELNNNVCWA